MTLYEQFSYDNSFCVFRKLVADLVANHVEEDGLSDNAYLCISKYLELSIQCGLGTESDSLCKVPVVELVVQRPNDAYAPNYDLIDKLSYKYIIVPSQQPVAKYEVLKTQMLQDYDNNLFPNRIFEPYFSWKKGEIETKDISCHQLEAMTDEADRLLEYYDAKYPDAHNIHDSFIVDDPWQFTRGYGEDKCIVAYLGLISDQLVELRLVR